MLRQGRRDLELIRMTPDLLYDQMIGMGAARRLVFSYGGNPGVGSLHRFRDAIEHGWPRPLEIEEHSHAGMANRYAAGAAGLPFALMRGYVGTDLMEHTRVERVTCPFTGEQLAAVPALRPDVAIVHAQEADRRGQRAALGHPRRAEGGGARGAPLARHRRADRRRARAAAGRRRDPRLGDRRGRRGAGRLAAVLRARASPRATTTSTASGTRISRDRDEFRAWMDEHVLRRRGGVSADARRGADGRRGPPAARARGRSSSASAGRARRRSSPRMVHNPDLVLVYESGTIGAKPFRDPAVDRRRRAGRDRRRRRLGARDVQLLDRARADRRRVPRRRAGRPLRATSTRP